MSTPEQFMRRAIELSRQHMQAGHGGPFGAVVVRDGKIIGEGWNCVTSSHDPTAHAEVMAIRRACENVKDFDLSDCEIYTSCEPCPMCLAAIYWARIGAIYQANTRDDAAAIDFDDAYLYRELLKPLDQRDVPVRQMLRDEAQVVFREWTQKADRIEY
ncbi:MAG TPA: nucleoside deaminase [Pseudobdellovibrionaceae bacterium]|nr:nucleoside deaminase [Pseudobdellovibrionaceae bacterium]